jgi:hypothetical protein
MSIDTTPTQNGTDSTDTITDLRDLRVGDRVVFGDRTQPLTVADLGERVHGTGDDEIATPIVRVEGDWRARTRTSSHTSSSSWATTASRSNSQSSRS